MRKRILVVDDNPVNLKLTASLLELEGYEVVTAIDAEAALDALTRQLPDLVLMDLAMPRVDGLTLTRMLRADPRYAALPIVALTASAMKGDSTRALEAGCTGYIPKPIDTRQFPRTIAGYMSAAPAPDRLRIVVVDDNRIDLKLVDTLLQVSGHLVIGRESPTGMAAELAEMRPDAVLLDLQFGDSDGLSLLRLLRADAATRDIPVVAVTAYPEAFPRERVLEAGCDDYWTKPVDTRTLAARLERLVARRRSGAA